MPDSLRSQLRRFIIEHALRYSTEPITLSSGAESHHYFDIRKVSLHPVGQHLLASVLLHRINLFSPYATAVGGPASSALPIISSIVALSTKQTHPLHGFYTRREPKPYGLKCYIENLPRASTKVVIVDDVVTSGNSILRSARIAMDYNLDVVGAISVIDRKSKDSVKLHHLKYESIFLEEAFVMDEHASDRSSGV